MKPDWTKLTIHIEKLDCNRLLSDWRWLVNGSYVPFSMTMFGDWFFTNSEGAVYMLDLISGDLKLICESREEFLVKREEPANLDEWFMAELAYLCFDASLRPAAGQCLGFKIPPVIGGKVHKENIEVISLLVYQT